MASIILNFECNAGSRPSGNDVRVQEWTWWRLRSWLFMHSTGLSWRKQVSKRTSTRLQCISANHDRRWNPCLLRMMAIHGRHAWRRRWPSYEVSTAGKGGLAKRRSHIISYPERSLDATVGAVYAVHHAFLNGEKLACPIRRSGMGVLPSLPRVPRPHDGGWVICTRNAIAELGRNTFVTTWRSPHCC